VTRRNSILLVAVAAVAVMAAYWMLVLTPKREEAAKLDKQITVKQTALASAEAEVADYENARANYRANYSMVARLGKAVPVDDDVRSLMVQINAAAGHSGVDFRTINVAGSGAAAAAAPSGTADGATTTAAPPPGATAIGTAGFSTMPFAFRFQGSFFELGKFFNRLDKFVAVRNRGLDVTGRLLLLNSITLTPDATKGFPMLSADVSANSYLLPPTEGLTAGATAAGPAGSGTTAAPAASATPAPSTPATTTTATITGVTR
jgi:hypothetical protein